MNECAAQRGFLMFRNCGNPATNECSTCGRPMCSEHLSAASGFTTCLDCSARQQGDKWQGANGHEWAYGFRHRYYAAGLYHPIGIDRTDPYYDDYDVRSFDSRAKHAAALDDDEREPGFGDS